MVIPSSIRNALAAATLVAALASAPVVAGQIDLAWDAVPGATGYRIYYGTATRSYTQSITSSTTSASVTNLADCQNWFVAVKAYNSAGESAQFSNELSGWPRPSVTSASPGAVQQGQQVVVDISGKNFRSGATVEINNTRVALASVAVLSCDRVQLLATVEPRAANAAPARAGRFSVTVVNPDAVFGSRSETFEVTVNPSRFDVNKTDTVTSGRLDGKDIAWVARRFGGQEGTSTYDPNFDFDGDGWVDGNELAYIASNLGRCWSGSAWTVAACPEGQR